MANLAPTGFRGFVARLFGRGGVIVPVVRLQGVIAADQRPGRINIQNVAPLLARAFAMKKAPAVAIIVNSPGGSPVQSRLIAKRIRDLARENNKKVLVFVEDAAASGGYFIATAGDDHAFATGRHHVFDRGGATVGDFVQTAQQGGLGKGSHRHLSCGPDGLIVTRVSP